MARDIHAEDLVGMNDDEVARLPEDERDAAVAVRQAHQERIDAAAHARAIWPVAPKAA